MSRWPQLAAFIGLALVTHLPNGVAQSAAKVWHIGVFHVGLDHVPPSVPALRQKLMELGYTDGANIRFDFRNQKNMASARRTARDFVTEGVDLIVAVENQALRAAIEAKANTPILFFHVLNPVGEGFVQSYAHPGGRVTGLASPKVVAKRLELFKEANPNLQRVLCLLDPADPGTGAQLAKTRAAARQLGLQLIERNMSTAADAKQVFNKLGKGEADGVFVVSSSLRTTFSGALIAMTREHGLPIVGHRRAWAVKGALLSYGDDFAAVGRAAATYVVKLLAGASPAELPVDERSGIRLVVNRKTAQALGITIPPSILLRADEVIE